MNYKPIDKSLLIELYIVQKMNPYQIAEELGCNHKTVRSYLVRHDIPLRSSSEYNYLPRKSHSSPSLEALQSPLSVAAHTAYLCEGWHTDKTDYLSFCNQDPALIRLFIRSLREVYRYTSTIRVVISHNGSEESTPKVSAYRDLFKEEKVFLSNDTSRKNPIVIIKAGGKNLAREFIANAYSLLSCLVGPAGLEPATKEL